MARQAIITLTSDFGLVDPYVASMKGVILSLNPQAIVVDVSHSMGPRRIEQAAFLLQTACPYFPAGAIHLAVVDPGVGTERTAMALQTSRGTFVGPDTGVLSAALPGDVRSAVAEGGGRVRLAEDVLGVALTNPRYHRQPVSSTFHGRDIFAPAAAHLSLGVPLSELGEAIEEAFVLPPFRATRQTDGSLVGRVIHIDTFGNLITDIHGDDLGSRRVTVEIADRQIVGIDHTYAGERRLTALVSSYGFLEIALPGASAARELHVEIGEPVKVSGA
ncbi:MAG: SAM-dependent chlorinase/fluorinase [Dehalococcoidia bacterium]